MTKKLTCSQTQSRTNVTYKTNRSFLDKVDNLPTHGPEWILDMVQSPGDRLDENGKPMNPEELELWRRDPVECVKELISNPAFINDIQYVPEKHYTDNTRTNREYSEMWTADWWWDIQVRPCKPVITAISLMSTS